jgi:hypothetical protein
MPAHRKKAKIQQLFLLSIRSNFALGLRCEVFVPACHVKFIDNFNKVWRVDFLSYIATHIHIVQVSFSTYQRLLLGRWV